MNIRELGPTWSLAVDIFFGVWPLVVGLLALVAVKKKWGWFYYREFWYPDKLVGREFIESCVVVAGIIFILIGAFFLVKAGLALF